LKGAGNRKRETKKSRVGEEKKKRKREDRTLQKFNKVLEGVGKGRFVWGVFGLIKHKKRGTRTFIRKTRGGGFRNLWQRSLKLTVGQGQKKKRGTDSSGVVILNSHQKRGKKGTPNKKNDTCKSGGKKKQ